MTIDLKMIDEVYQILGGITIGVISYWITAKIRPISLRKEAMQNVMKNALLPILRILETSTKTKVEIESAVSKIHAVMFENPFLIPPMHQAKIEYIQELLKLSDNYEENDSRKSIANKRILSEFAEYRGMVDLQENYIRKQLGYPYNSFFDFLRYKTGAPILMGIMLFYVCAVWLGVYIYLNVTNQQLLGLVWLITPALAFFLFALGYHHIKHKGGLKLFLNDWRNKIAVRKIEKSLRKTQSKTTIEK